MKKLLLAAVIAASSTGLTSIANADVSANIGYMSDYYYRGFYQAGSVASAGVDYEEGGFYAGVWAADVNTDGAAGVEVDYYLGYGIEVEGVALGVGFTSYQYSNDFDEPYNEVNLTAGFGPVSIEHSIGEYSSNPNSQDYTFSALTYEAEGMYVTFGFFGDDFDGNYTEIGYGAEVGGFDAGIALISSDKDISKDPDEGEISLVFSLGKSFDL